VLDLLLSRPSWQRKLLAAIERDEVQPAQIDAAHRQRLLTVTGADLRETAARLLAGNINPDRQRVLQEHLPVTKLAGDRERGKAVFAKVCATCHVLEKTGTAVGPDLAALASKSPEFLLQEILDPNRNVDSRYVQYLALTTAGRTFSGLLASESGTSITLKGPEGKLDVLLRSDIDELQSTSKSLMPEGLEKDLTHQNLADLIAFVSATTDPQALAARLLDEATPREQREAIVANYPTLASELITAMTVDLPVGSPDEYRRIPWIWRVAIASGKRNDEAQLRQLLEVSLPPQEGVLRDWQAVVIGGGLINGITQSGDWPAERFGKVFQERPKLKARWQQALAQSARMADDVAVRSGTRYDALRMVALDDWQRSGPQLTKYLKKGTSAELQMGAVSGLADIDRNEVSALLLAALEYLPARNRELAVEGLLRTDRRTAALLEALRQKQITPEMLSPAQVQRLRMHTNEQLRATAAELLP
jgi:putative heme-binding domain-containing protein